MVTVTHAHVSAIVDDGSDVGSNEWNANHVVSISGSDITTALGYTPADPGNYNTASNPLAYGSASPFTFLSSFDVQLPTGSDLLGLSGIATNATKGFIRDATCAGTPTGTPTNGAGATVLDTTNNKLYMYINGSWTLIYPQAKPMSEIEFLASQSLAGNYINVTGTVTTKTTVCSYTPATGKTFTAYMASLSLGATDTATAASVEVRNNTTVRDSLQTTFTSSSSFAQNSALIKGDQLIGNSTLTYSIVTVVMDAAISVRATLAGYIQ